jgi:hypothetical protein
MTPGDRVAQLYPQALGTRFSRLLRHARVTVGLFFNPGHHMGGCTVYAESNDCHDWGVDKDYVKCGYSIRELG